jgi:hypothetical protein
MRRIIFILALALCACASHQVRCDRHLQPINAPAANQPVAPAESAP